MFPGSEQTIKSFQWLSRRLITISCFVLGNPKCNSKTWDSYGGYDNGCCKTNALCGIGEGDCDKDSDCLEGLSCGDNNCVGKGFTKQADCCYLNSKQS